MIRIFLILVLMTSSTAFAQQEIKLFHCKIPNAKADAYTEKRTATTGQKAKSISAELYI